MKVCYLSSSFIAVILTASYWVVIEQAKKETVDKVCEIVKSQLALDAATEVCGSSKFTDLGADSLDTVSHPRWTLLAPPKG